MTLTRITFPYLLFVTLVTIYSGILNAHDRFAAAAARARAAQPLDHRGARRRVPVPDAGHAAAWGVAAAGVLELGLVLGRGAAGRRSPPGSRRRGSTPVMSVFFKTLGPAVVGSAGVQIAMFADTIIASFLPTGAVSSLYYADRIYQLPLGVIGIAAGTVLLPEMSRRIAAGDVAGAHAAQNRALGLTLALAAPFVVGLPGPAGPHHVGPVPARRLRRGGGAAARERCSPPTRSASRRRS